MSIDIFQAYIMAMVKCDYVIYAVLVGGAWRR